MMVYVVQCHVTMHVTVTVPAHMHGCDFMDVDTLSQDVCY